VADKTSTAAAMAMLRKRVIGVFLRWGRDLGTP
jgi:hypothetical protein